ncbi:MAG: hypothetical protein WB995_19190, partial [Candidatus Acidiferrales bacterium]
FRMATEPALKRTVKGKAFSGALKRSFPRMNAGAATENRTGRTADNLPGTGQIVGGTARCGGGLRRILRRV